MYSRDDKEWFNYCKALNLNPYDKRLLSNIYYLRGFEEWKRLNKAFSYYNYQSYVISYPKW